MKLGFSWRVLVFIAPALLIYATFSALPAAAFRRARAASALSNTSGAMKGVGLCMAPLCTPA